MGNMTWAVRLVRPVRIKFGAPGPVFFYGLFVVSALADGFSVSRLIPVRLVSRAGGEEEVRGLGRGGRLGGGGGLGGDQRSHALSMSEHLFRCQGNCSLWRKLV